MTGAPALFPGGEIAISGEVQFWRMPPETWETALRSVRDLGITTIGTYLSWRRHEPRPGRFDLRGGHGAELDVHRFLRLCAEIGLRVILKPGPWICAEEPGGGLPDWIIDDDRLIALDHAGNQVSGYNPPFKHPMPSYASVEFRRHVATWIQNVWADLAPFLGPDGPIVATQFDNEPSLGFQDAMYGFDHHPDALASWYDYVGEVVEPPRPRVGGPADPTPVETRWADWQRHYIADYLVWLKRTHTEAGAGRLTGTVNLNTHPVRGWPQDGAILAELVTRAVVGEDHYFVPPLDESDLAGLALAAAQSRTTRTPLSWAPEMQAGIWRSPGEEVDYPDPSATELLGWWGAALALGYQGFHLYMLVDRENWGLAPLADDGTVTPLGRLLGDFLATVASVPDLSDFRPVPDATLAWDDGIRRSAYRVRGTQSVPLSAWDDPAARSAYDASEAAALGAVRAGVQFDLSPTGAGSASAHSAAAISVPDGYLARVHRHPDGRALLYVVRWGRHADVGPVVVRVAAPAPWTGLVSTADGRKIARDEDSFTLASGTSAFGIYTLVD